MAPYHSYPWLIIDHEGKVLLVKSDAGGWQLPGTHLSGDDPGSVTARIMTELEAGLLKEHGLDVPWMTYVVWGIGETAERAKSVARTEIS